MHKARVTITIPYEQPELMSYNAVVQYFNGKSVEFDLYMQTDDFYLKKQSSYQSLSTDDISEGTMFKLCTPVDICSALLGIYYA